jgi:hypothetical protein
VDGHTNSVHWAFRNGECTRYFDLRKERAKAEGAEKARAELKQDGKPGQARPATTDPHAGDAWFARRLPFLDLSQWSDTFMITGVLLLMFFRDATLLVVFSEWGDRDVSDRVQMDGQGAGPGQAQGLIRSHPLALSGQGRNGRHERPGHADIGADMGMSACPDMSAMSAPCPDMSADRLRTPMSATMSAGRTSIDMENQGLPVSQCPDVRTGGHDVRTFFGPMSGQNGQMSAPMSACPDMTADMSGHVRTDVRMSGHVRPAPLTVVRPRAKGKELVAEMMAADTPVSAMAVMVGKSERQVRRWVAEIKSSRPANLTSLQMPKRA